MKLLILSALLLAFVATGSAQAPDVEAAAQAGAVLFRANCARCHGVGLEGGKKAPKLVDIREKKHWTDERITNRILKGEGKMPSFRDSLSADQIQQIVAFLRAENRPPVLPAPDPK